MQRLNTREGSFDADLQALLALDMASDPAVEQVVRDIIAAIRNDGDRALLDYTARFDRYKVADAGALEIPATRLQQALDSTAADLRMALNTAAERIRAYHQRQRLESWSYTDTEGTRLGQQVTALDRVGLYVPGGKAAYPSSVLMNAIPAHVAGVEEIIMVVPTPDGEFNETVLAAAALAGVSRVFSIGGAQAVAALAWGTATVPAVDKIVGPGNAYVAAAKRMVFGKVGIDMIAGPSEVLIISDGSGDPDWLAMDMFAQSEHDEAAQAIVLCPDADFLNRVEQAIERLLPTMQRRPIITASLQSRGALIQVADLAEAVQIANRIAAEHLELAVDDPDVLIPQIRHAGAIFAGHHTAEVFGDYCAGPNHVLPTARTARFSSPLGVYDFQKRTSIIQCSPASSRQLSGTAATLAYSEGLEAHARSAGFRGTVDSQGDD